MTEVEVLDLNTERVVSTEHLKFVPEHGFDRCFWSADQVYREPYLIQGWDCRTQTECSLLGLRLKELGEWANLPSCTAQMQPKFKRNSVWSMLQLGDNIEVVHGNLTTGEWSGLSVEVPTMPRPKRFTQWVCLELGDKVCAVTAANDWFVPVDSESDDRPKALIVNLKDPADFATCTIPAAVVRGSLTGCAGDVLVGLQNGGLMQLGVTGTGAEQRLGIGIKLQIPAPMNSPCRALWGHENYPVAVCNHIPGAVRLWLPDNPAELPRVLAKGNVPEAVIPALPLILYSDNTHTRTLHHELPVTKVVTKQVEPGFHMEL
jgi:hypothetical protein